MVTCTQPQLGLSSLYSYSQSAMVVDNFARPLMHDSVGSESGLFQATTPVAGFSLEVTAVKRELTHTEALRHASCHPEVANDIQAKRSTMGGSSCIFD